MDIDDTFTVDPSAVEAAITPRTVGLLPVHLYGHPADLDRLLAIADARGLWLVEDCAQSQGAAYRGKSTGGELRRVGSIGFAGAYSFFPSKNLTVLGDGGCLVLDDDALARKLRMLRNHGREDKYTHEFPGWNMRFNEVQAAIGRVGLKALDPGNERRRQIAALYRDLLKDVVVLPPEAPWAQPVYHMYVIRVPEGGAERRDALARALKEKGIGTGIHYPVPNHLQPAVKELFRANGWTVPPLPRTEEAAGSILSLPMHPELPDDDVRYVAQGVRAFFS